MTPRCTTCYIVAFSVILILVNVAFTVYLALNTAMLDALMLPFVRGSAFFPYAQGVSLTMNLFLSCAWLLPIFMTFIMTMTIASRFLKLNKNIEKSIEEANNTKQMFGKF